MKAKTEFFNEKRPDGKFTGRSYSVRTDNDGKMYVKWHN